MRSSECSWGIGCGSSPSFGGLLPREAVLPSAAPVGMASGITAWQGFVSEVRNLLAVFCGGGWLCSVLEASTDPFQML